ncbi:MAG: NAD(P)-dependent oxidoreductase [Nitrospirae bacterium]|nr:NAD(P)-dependent oxidoreductase [Nitrospirota bacterium]
MKKLLVTGASGFLGWNICNIAKKEWDVYGTICSKEIEINGVNVVKIDLTRLKDLTELFHNINPAAVIHTAAATKPNYCQANKEKTKKINTDASIHIAKLCSEQGIPYLFTSTDLIFDGLNAPYRENDPVSPVNAYGEQKVLAEEGILKHYPLAAVCRMPLMFGSTWAYASSFIQPMIKSIKEGEEIKLFIDEFRTPAWGEDAVKGLFIALEKADGIIHLGGRERVSRYEIGSIVKELLNMPRAKLTPCFQKDIPMAAPRSPDVSLDSSKAYALGFNPATIKEGLKQTISAIF